MKRLTIGFLVIALFFTTCLNAFSQHINGDDMEIIKDYKPDDKYFKAGLVSLHFIIETSSIDRVDSVFQQLIDAYKLPSKADGIKDGVYTGASPYDAFDYKHVVELEIKDGKIISIDYNEVHKSGRGKQEDKAYCEEMSITGTTPAIAYPNMEQQLLAKQDMLQVDGVSGASYSLYRFRYAITIALIKAILNNK
ncbi:hypothetical protein ACFLU5_04335 [Bacteroidota bacterium]